MKITKQPYKKPASLTDTVFSYCPGCSHGTVHKIIAEIIDELNMREKTVCVAPVGCAVFAYDFFNFDVTEAAHGRASAVATAMKRVLPDRLVFAYQGDGDLASIGMAETIHTASRGENVTVIFINNTNYGMTGGQLSPTTLINQKTTTSQEGRDLKNYGYPIRVPELLQPMHGVKYLARVKVTDAAAVLAAKRAIRKGFSNQLANVGYSMIEVLSSCPANWKMEPLEANKFVDTAVADYYKIGVIKDVS